MSVTGIQRSSSTRSVKKLEKPRPLKISGIQTRISSIETSPHLPISSWDDIMQIVDTVSQSIANQNFDGALHYNIVNMNSHLKIHGQQLESVYKDQLDRAFVIFRNGCGKERLNFISRVLLLELIELRANQWYPCDQTQSYYQMKMATPDVEPLPTTPDALSSGVGLINLTATSPTNTTVLNIGEVLKPSGKYPRPTKVPGKNYCKDEVVIRNSDSGKVMGIKGRRVHLIEELSETIISFQRVNPGAKERLVQITGPSEEKITHARQLIKDTIVRNASPVREIVENERMGGSSSSLNSSASDESNRLPQTGMRPKTLLHSFSTNDANINEYKYTVTVGNNTLKITGDNLELVRSAKLILDEHLVKSDLGESYRLGDEDVFVSPSLSAPRFMNSFDGNGSNSFSTSGESDDITCINAIVSDTPPGTSRAYSRDFILVCANSQFSVQEPPGWDVICRDFPAVVKKVPHLVPFPYHHFKHNDSSIPQNPENYMFDNAWTENQYRKGQLIN
uniref:K Homology domain-containing protein n=2 Tax=Clastoptera arizonana TaxID=38151 RepID=A0A1B6D1H2_9HEMI